MRKWQVGQEVYVVPMDQRYSKPKFATILKIGRRWATLGPYSRFDIETGLMDSGEYPARVRVYSSKEEYDAEFALCSAWRKFARDVDLVRGNHPNGVTIDGIAKARKILGMKPE